MPSAFAHEPIVNLGLASSHPACYGDHALPPSLLPPKSALYYGSSSGVGSGLLPGGAGLPRRRRGAHPSNRPINTVDRGLDPILSSETILGARRRNSSSNDDDSVPSNVLSDATAALASAVSTPIPVPAMAGATIPLGYPLALAVATALFPLGTSVLLDAFFVGYWILGRVVTSSDEDDDGDGVGNGNGSGEKCGDDVSIAGRDVADLTALAGAVATAGLLSPDGFTAAGFAVGGGLSGLIGAGAVALTGVAVALSLAGQQKAQVDGREEEEGGSAAGRRMMDLWDEKLERSDDGD